MSYQLYRNTTLGNTLQESLDELIQYGQITPQLALKVLVQFDKSINTALSTKVKSRVTFKAGKLHTYRFCDNVWTLMLKDVEFREVRRWFCLTFSNFLTFVSLYNYRFMNLQRLIRWRLLLVMERINRSTVTRLIVKFLIRRWRFTLSLYLFLFIWMFLIT